MTATISPPAPTANTVAWTADDLHAWQVLRPLLEGGRYLPWSSGAMRPAGLVDVCNEIVLGGRGRIVELGSGTSTILLARLLRQRGGELTAVEHHEGWAKWVTNEVAAESLQHLATVVHAPLEPASHAAGDLAWYSEAIIASVAGTTPIDLLIVDGPPAFDPGMGLARLPALLTLIDHLTPDAVVVLDDIARDGEQSVLAHWQDQTPFTFTTHVSGIATGRRTS